eukprot:scaffold918_cov126-Cylindrotheca_fusiformis.AAC.77
MIRHNSKRITLALQGGVKRPSNVSRFSTGIRPFQAIHRQRLASTTTLYQGVGPTSVSPLLHNPLESSCKRSFATAQDESSTQALVFDSIPQSPKFDADDTSTTTNSDETVVPTASRGRESKPIQLVQLQGLHSEETIRDSFLPTIKRADAARLKWITTLKNQLLNKPKQKKKTKTKKKSTTSYMSHTQSYLRNQPKEMRSAFWDLVLAGNDESRQGKEKTKKQQKPPKSHIEVLQKVRESAVEFPLMWSQNRKRIINKENQQKATSGKAYSWKTYLATRSETLSSIHNSKSEEELMEEATRMVETLYQSLPPRNYEKLIATFHNHLEACELDRKMEKGAMASNRNKKKRIQILFTNIRKPASTNIHFVAPDLADFLYVTVDDDFKSSRNYVVSDPRVVESQISFDNMLEQFLDSFTTVHGLLWKEFQHQKNDKRENKNPDDSSAHVSSDDSVEAVMESFHDAVMSPETTKSTSKKKGIKSDKERTYVLFEAIALQSYPPNREERSAALPSTSPDLPNFPSKSPNDRLIIVDNLPIDINESLLLDAYSRCGSIETLSVFNRRPHLDPGRRHVDSQKKIRNPSSFRQQWQRPRTPLYAMILFDDAKSAAKASSDPLRIFGMVLDRHLIRSYPSKDMTKLYLEDISGKYDTTTIEYQLSQILHPELYVCLDIDGEQRPSSRRRHQDDRSTSSCIIKFPDFEAAYWSYLKLSSELELLKQGDCALQWMETPRDAMMYWTRKLNF